VDVGLEEALAPDKLKTYFEEKKKEE